jgi:aquaporin Z
MRLRLSISNTRNLVFSVPQCLYGETLCQIKVNRHSCRCHGIRIGVMRPAFARESTLTPSRRSNAVEPLRAELNLRTALRSHWPEYLMEAAELGLFMISACVVVALLEHPLSPFNRGIPNAFVRRALTGIAMGLTAVAIVYSPWGKQSGAHFNPSVTLTFWRLGKVSSCDAACYVVAQFAGGLGGVLIAAAALGAVLAHPAVNYVATVPGAGGSQAAFLAELVISFGLMTVVLTVSNTPSLARYTGLFAGVLVAAFISFEAPISGMSMNPARTFGPALLAHLWAGAWVYFTAPPLGMLMAAEVYVRIRSRRSVGCAKLHHQNTKRCIFCDYHEAKSGRRTAPESRGIG